MNITKEKVYSHEQERIAKLSRALANPIRVFILDYLHKHQDRCCYSGDLAGELPIARSTLSEHLKELKKAGLIQGEINPPFIKYCLNRENWLLAKNMFNQFFKE